MSVKLLLQLLVGPVDTELLKRVLLEVLETVLQNQQQRYRETRPAHDIQDSDKLGSLFCSNSTFATQTLVDDTNEPLLDQRRPE